MMIVVVQMVVVAPFFKVERRKFCPEVWSINSRRVISCLVCLVLVYHP